MSIATIISEGFGSFGTVNFVPTEGFGNYGIAPVVVVTPPLLGGGGHRWNDVKRLYKRRPDDEVLDDHLAALAAHLLGLERVTPALRKATAVIRDSDATIEAMETGQWEMAELAARAAIIESKVAGLERVRARLRKEAEDDDDEVFQIILGHA